MLFLFLVNAKKSALITDLFVSVTFWTYLLSTYISPKSISFFDNSTIGPIEFALIFIKCYMFLSETISIIKSISNILIQVVIRFMFILMEDLGAI